MHRLSDGDLDPATTVWPELTTVHQPVASMADAAIDILLRSIRRAGDDARVIVNHVVPHQLIMRDSVAPPKAKRRSAKS